MFGNEFIDVNGTMIWKEHRKCLKKDCEFNSLLSIDCTEIDHIHLEGKDRIDRINFLNRRFSPDIIKELKENTEDCLCFYSKIKNHKKEDGVFRYQVSVYSKKMNNNWFFYVDSIDEDYIQKIEKQVIRLKKLLEN